MITCHEKSNMHHLIWRRCFEVFLLIPLKISLIENNYTKLWNKTQINALKFWPRAYDNLLWIVVKLTLLLYSKKLFVIIGLKTKRSVRIRRRNEELKILPISVIFKNKTIYLVIFYHYDAHFQWRKLSWITLWLLWWCMINGKW